MEIVGAISSGALPSLDLAAHQEAKAQSLVRTLTADRRNRLSSRDDAVLSLALGTTQKDMLSRASARRADEALARDAARTTDLLSRPGSRMSLAHLPGSTAAALAASRGLSGTHSSPHALLGPTEVERMHSEILAATYSNAFGEDAEGTSGGSAADASALYVAPAIRGFGLATKAVSENLERSRRASSAARSARKYSALVNGVRSSAGGREGSPPPEPSPRGEASRLDARDFLLQLGPNPEKAVQRVVSPRQVFDDFDLPVDEERGAAILRARSPQSPRPRTSDSPFVPRRLLPSMPRSPPSSKMAAEIGRTYAGAGDYSPASHAFRERRLAAEQGPAKAVTGMLNAEPRRFFNVGGLHDAVLTAQIEAERANSRTARGAHPFIDSKQVRATLHEPWIEHPQTAFSGRVIDNGAYNTGDAVARSLSIGRPYILLPRHVDELRIDGGNTWRAWSSPVKRAPDDLRGFSPKATAATLTEADIAKYHEGASYDPTLIAERRGPQPPVELLSPQDIAVSKRRGSASSIQAGTTATATYIPPICISEAASASAAPLPDDHGASEARENRAGDTAANLPPCESGGGSRGAEDDEVNDEVDTRLFSAEALPALIVTANATVFEVGASPVGHSIAGKLELDSPRHGYGSPSRSIQTGFEGVAPSCYRNGTWHGASNKLRASSPRSPGLPQSPHSPRVLRLQHPGKLIRTGSLVRCTSSHTIDIGEFARTGIDTVREASAIGAPTGVPPAISTTTSRWEGPWQGGPVSDVSFAHSPMRDGIAHYRRLQQGAEPIGSSPFSQYAPSGTISPRSSVRLAETLAGRDASLASPSSREMIGAVSGTPRARTPGASSPARLGSLEAAVTSREAARVLAAAIHPGASGFLGMSHPRPDLSSTLSDMSTTVSPKLSATPLGRSLSSPRPSPRQ